MRFSEFDDFWLPTTLSSICSFRKKRKSSIKKFYVSTENILQNYKGVEQYNSNEVISGVEFLTGDILMANIRPYLKKVYMAEFDGVCNSDVLIFKSDMVDSNFLHCILANDNFINYVMNSVKGSKMPRGDKIHIMNYHLSIPKAKEQEKIAKFIDLINQRIDTQSKIIEDLELFKKGIWNYIYLTKSSDWKCVKLSDILCERKDFALKGDEFIHATLSKDGIFAKTDRYDRDFLVTNDEKEYKITRLNDICYNPANLKFGVICLNKFGDAIFSPIYVTYIVKNNFIPSFVELILTSSRFLKYIRKYEQGTVYERMAVNSEDFLKGEILTPIKDKQKAIADYFNILDLKIKKEKDILELYKKQKAYLLKNMFI